MGLMIKIVAPLLMGGVLSPGAFYQSPSTGLWTCTATCLTSGRRDGGQCYTKTIIVENEPSRDSCRDKMREACDKVPPPTGGCVRR